MNDGKLPFMKLSNFLNRARSKRNEFKDQIEGPEGASPVDEFLKPISYIESSGGVDTDHRTLEDGIHEGDVAVGTYGIMPNTAIDLSNKVTNPDAVLRQQLPFGMKLPKVEELKNLSKEEIAERIKSDPDLERKLARLLATEVLAKNEGDEERGAYAWNMGTNLTKEKIKDEDLESHPYIGKFRKLRERLRKGKVD